MNPLATKSPTPPQSAELSSTPSPVKPAQKAPVSHAHSPELSAAPKAPVAVSNSAVTAPTAQRQSAELSTAPKTGVSASISPVMPPVKLPHSPVPSSAPATATKPAQLELPVVTASLQPTVSTSTAIPAKADARVKADAAAFIEQNPRAVPAPKSQPRPAQSDKPAAPSTAPAPGFLPDGSPDLSPAGIQARIEARQEAERIKKEARLAKKKTSKTPKGYYIEKLKALEFEKLSEVDARKAYVWMQDRFIKSGLQRNNAIKVLFTDAEFERIKKIARDLKIENSKAVRRLCFTGPSSEKVLAEYVEIKKALLSYSSNLNQVMHYLNSKKVNMTEDKAKEVLESLTGLREKIQALDSRLMR